MPRTGIRSCMQPAWHRAALRCLSSQETARSFVLYSVIADRAPHDGWSLSLSGAERWPRLSRCTKSCRLVADSPARHWLKAGINCTSCSSKEHRGSTLTRTGRHRRRTADRYRLGSDRCLCLLGCPSWNTAGFATAQVGCLVLASVRGLCTVSRQAQRVGGRQHALWTRGDAQTTAESSGIRTSYRRSRVCADQRFGSFGFGPRQPLANSALCDTKCVSDILLFPALLMQFPSAKATIFAQVCCLL